MSNAEKNNKLSNSHEMKWYRRYEEALRNETLFNDTQIKTLTYDEYEKIIRNHLESFLSNKDDINEDSIVKVDMVPVRSSNSELKSHIADVLTEVVEKLKLYKNYRFLKVQEYIYVVQRKDGMVVVVGKSSFHYNIKEDFRNVYAGDLFNNMDLRGITGTPLIILMTLLQDDFRKYSKKINEYYKTAWIIPVPNHLNKNTEELEEELGDYLLNNKVPILNTFSHRKSKNI